MPTIRLQHLCICMVLKFEISKHACSKLKKFLQRHQKPPETEYEQFCKRQVYHVS